MSSDYHRGEALARLLGPPGHEVTCQRCFDLVDEYVELQFAGIEPGSLLPGVRAHLEGCPACNEDHECLHALLVRLAAKRN